MTMKKDTTTNTNTIKDTKKDASENIKSVETLENGKKKITLNAEKFKDANYVLTERSTMEETADKPRLEHKPQNHFDAKKKKESTGYYGIRRLTFELTKKEFKTPQNNLRLIADFLKSKGIQLSDNLGTYVARDYGIHFYPANAPKMETVLIAVSDNGTSLKIPTEKQILDAFKPYQTK